LREWSWLLYARIVRVNLILVAQLKLCGHPGIESVRMIAILQLASFIDRGGAENTVSGRTDEKATINYTFIKDNWFVVSGTNSLGFEFYTKFLG
jgi:hypothetical protein